MYSDDRRGQSICCRIDSAAGALPLGRKRAIKVRWLREEKKQKVVVPMAPWRHPGYNSASAADRIFSNLARPPTVCSLVVNYGNVLQWASCNRGDQERRFKVWAPPCEITPKAGGYVQGLLTNVRAVRNAVAEDSRKPGLTASDYELADGQCTRREALERSLSTTCNTTRRCRGPTRCQHNGEPQVVTFQVRAGRYSIVTRPMCGNYLCNSCRPRATIIEYLGNIIVSSQYP